MSGENSSASFKSPQDRQIVRNLAKQIQEDEQRQKYGRETEGSRSNRHDLVESASDNLKSCHRLESETREVIQAIRTLWAKYLGVRRLVSSSTTTTCKSCADTAATDLDFFSADECLDENDKADDKAKGSDITKTDQMNDCFESFADFLHSQCGQIKSHPVSSTPTNGCEVELKNDSFSFSRAVNDGEEAKKKEKEEEKINIKMGAEGQLQSMSSNTTMANDYYSCLDGNAASWEYCATQAERKSNEVKQQCSNGDNRVDIIKRRSNIRSPSSRDDPLTLLLRENEWLVKELKRMKGDLHHLEDLLEEKWSISEEAKRKAEDLKKSLLKKDKEIAALREQLKQCRESREKEALNARQLSAEKDLVVEQGLKKLKLCQEEKEGLEKKVGSLQIQLRVAKIDLAWNPKTMDRRQTVRDHSSNDMISSTQSPSFVRDVSNTIWLNDTDLNS